MVALALCAGAGIALAQPVPAPQLGQVSKDSVWVPTPERMIRRLMQLADVTPHVLRHSFASIANDLGFTEVTIAALVGHAKGSVTSKYIHTLDTALIMAADTISGYIQGLLDGQAFKQTAYALDRDSRKAALARFLQSAAASGHEGLPIAA